MAAVSSVSGGMVVVARAHVGIVRQEPALEQHPARLWPVEVVEHRVREAELGELRHCLAVLACMREQAEEQLHSGGQRIGAVGNASPEKELLFTGSSSSSV